MWPLRSYVQKNCTDLPSHVPLVELQDGTQHPKAYKKTLERNWSPGGNRHALANRKGRGGRDCKTSKSFRALTAAWAAQGDPEFAVVDTHTMVLY